MRWAGACKWSNELIVEYKALGDREVSLEKTTRDWTICTSATRSATSRDWLN